MKKAKPEKYKTGRTFFFKYTEMVSIIRTVFEWCDMHSEEEITKRFDEGLGAALYRLCKNARQPQLERLFVEYMQEGGIKNEEDDI